MTLETKISRATGGSTLVDEDGAVVLEEYRGTAGRGRSYALITNEGENHCWIMFGAPATAVQGIRIDANGGKYEISDVNSTSLAVHAVCLTGETTQLSWLEA